LRLDPLLQNDTVHYGGQHAYVVSMNSTDGSRICTTATIKISTSDNDCKPRPLAPREEKFASYQIERGGIYPLIMSPECFAAQLY
jgi:hypothetical protein